MSHSQSIFKVHICGIDHRVPEFAAQVYVVQAAAYAEEARLVGIDSRDFPPAQRTLTDIRHANEEFTVASLGESIVGAISVELPEIAAWCGQRLNTVHVASLVVLPAHQRNGIGRRLVETIIENHPNEAITVSTASGNAPALALYRKLGFGEARRTTINCAGRHLGLILLRREPGTRNSA